MVVSVRPDVDQTGAHRVTERRPRQGHTAVRELDASLEEVGGDVQRHRDAVLDEHGYGDVGEVGGAVVERDRHHRLGLSLAQRRDPIGQRHHARLRS